MGFKRLTPANDNGFEFEALLFDNGDKYTSYYKKVNDGSWKIHFNPQGYGLKLDAVVEYIKP
ncbi:hypothetical protein AM493_16520 [Flavobacterium akiainvivens]|uniref:Uncharacterized protein n=1 Tax=Flavobacterium akiainvivens TaxID=1202724 RepID=A0A0M9VJ85_9FLAO|nr:hypothetical protein [Flavobacterium akiainvivens]KOS07470.1 hypothetical protein AM493_16520 [Flavobacterium akiainvivens]SFQ63279.1 hypothetical protein SAMN05444144_11131 [Flavobacterium akiainvivens]